MLRPSRDLSLCDYQTELNYEKIMEYKPYMANPVKQYLAIVQYQQPPGVSQARGY